MLLETLAQKFNVTLKVIEGSDANETHNKGALKEASETACRLFEFFLLHTEHGHEALAYLL